MNLTREDDISRVHLSGNMTTHLDTRRQNFLIFASLEWSGDKVSRTIPLVGHDHHFVDSRNCETSARSIEVSSATTTTDKRCPDEETRDVGRENGACRAAKNHVAYCDHLGCNVAPIVSPVFLGY